MAGFAAARDAIREGAVAAWRVRVADPGAPGGGNQGPAPGSFTVRLSPRGQVVSFDTGTAADSAIAAAERTRAIGLGLDALKTTYGIDASAYEFEFIQRSFPAGTVEMTWRNPTPRFGHVEQLRVNLQGERIVLVERTFQEPRGYTEPKTSLAGRVLQLGGPVLIGGMFVAGWAFGLYVLFKTRNWDALTRPLPLAICALVLAQVALTTIGSGALHSALSIVAMSVLLVGTVLPALSGVTLWIGRQHPARLWAAEQLIRGKVLIRGVSASLVDGVAGGVVIAASGVLADWVALIAPRVRAVDFTRDRCGRSGHRLDGRRDDRRIELHRAWHCPGRGSARPGQAPRRGLYAHRRHRRRHSWPHRASRRFCRGSRSSPA